MKKTLFAVSLLIILPLLLAGCLPAMIFDSLNSPQPSIPSDFFQDEEDPGDFDGNTNGNFLNPFGYQYEALDWLSQSNSPGAFAKNRFDSTDEAVTFVKSLYEKGAVVVMVTNIYRESDVKGIKGEPYADTMMVVLPKDQHNRDTLLSLYRKEVRLFDCNGGNEESGMMGDTLMLQWYISQE